MKTNDQEMTNKELQIWIAGKERASAGGGTAPIDRTERTEKRNDYSRAVDLVGLAALVNGLALLVSA